MLLLRLLAVLVGIGICGSVFAYFFTRDARYLALAWRLFRWAIIVALVFFALLIDRRAGLRDGGLNAGSLSQHSSQNA